MRLREHTSPVNEELAIDEEDEDVEDADFNPLLQQASSDSIHDSEESEGTSLNLSLRSRSASASQATSKSSREHKKTVGDSCTSSGNDPCLHVVFKEATKNHSGVEIYPNLSSKLEGEQGTAGGERNVSGFQSDDASSHPGMLSKRCHSVGNNSQAFEGNFNGNELGEHPIGKRTRANLNLEDLTIDELEAYLELSEEEDFFKTVDDEEEYQKFLAAVMDPEASLSEEDVDDEDCDFFLEYDEEAEEPVQENEQNEPIAGEDNITQTRSHPRIRPLLPLAVPVVASRPMGFQEPQMAQLYRQIQEHVQLLIQVHTLSSLEPSLKETAASVKLLLGELLECRGRTRVLSHVPGSPKPTEGKSQTEILGEEGDNADKAAAEVDAEVALGVAEEAEIVTDHHHEQGGNGGGLSSSSILGVPLLNLLDNYFSLIDKVLGDSSQTGLPETPRDPSLSVPLFPETPQPSMETEMGMEETLTAGSQLPGSKERVSERRRKKGRRRFGDAVEAPVKLVLVPDSMADGLKPILALFNPKLFPLSCSETGPLKRPIFTEAEDRLLAMGVDLFNSNWEAIRQRFLPTKTANQIFIRHKNCIATKMPDNPVKEVRRRKLAPLTEHEKKCIVEAINIRKLGWDAVWQIYLPHRDPQLLPKLWRETQPRKMSFPPKTRRITRQRELGGMEEGKRKERGKKTRNEREAETLPLLNPHEVTRSLKKVDLNVAGVETVVRPWTGPPGKKKEEEGRRGSGAGRPREGPPLAETAAICRAVVCERQGSGRNEAVTRNAGREEDKSGEAAVGNVANPGPPVSPAVPSPVAPNPPHHGRKRRKKPYRGPPAGGVLRSQLHLPPVLLPDGRVVKLSQNEAFNYTSNMEGMGRRDAAAGGGGGDEGGLGRSRSAFTRYARNENGADEASRTRIGPHPLLFGGEGEEEEEEEEEEEVGRQRRGGSADLGVRVSVNLQGGVVGGISLRTVLPTPENIQFDCEELEDSSDEEDAAEGGESK